MINARRMLFSMAGLLAAAAALTTAPTIKVHAADETIGVPVTGGAVDPTLRGDGTMGPAAAAAKNRGALRLPADIERKAAADRAHAQAVRSGTLQQPNPAELAETGGAAVSSKAPAVVGGHKFAGQSGGTANTGGTPPDNEGAIGPSRYIQTINSNVKIYNRVNHTVIATGSLNALNGYGDSSGFNSFDPQIIWDASTNRFYYVMDTIASATDNRLTFGFSKTAAPTTVDSTSWCQYAIFYGTPFPDYPKLGDSLYFMIVGVNVFTGNSFTGSDIVAIRKPPAGTSCPTFASLLPNKLANIKDTGDNQVFTPTPSNQIDNNATGYVVARNGTLPSSKLWFFNVTKNPGTGAAQYGSARGLNVATYDIPASATQATFPDAPTSTLIDTSDTRLTQAVQAINPNRGMVHSFWTQHTIKNGSFSGVRWYEINPAPATPVVLRTGNTQSGAGSAFHFNAAIAPDRKKNGTTVAFGDSFVIQYNQASPTVSARILARSSLNGAALSAPVVVMPGVGPYRDFSCDNDPPGEGFVCRWGDYAAMTPDPAPTTSGRGEIWGTNQFSGLASPPAGTSNWRTEIFALQP